MSLSPDTREVQTPTEIDATNYLNQDFTASLRDLDNISQADSIKIQVNDGLDTALRELESLHDQFSNQDRASLLELCKNTVIESVTSQFGLASMFIDAKDGGSVTTTHNFEKGIAATDDDRKKYAAYRTNNDGSKPWDEVRKSAGYDKGFSKKRKATFNAQGVVVDAYTGKPLPKDGRAHIDHIVSAKEIESTAANHLFLTPEERANIATSEVNTAWTNSSANQSKGDLPMGKWLDKERKTGETNAEKYGINKEKALQHDKTARRHIKKQVTVATVKKYSAELMATGGKDAANMAAYSAVGVILRDLTQAVFEEIHVTFRQRGEESLKEIFIRFKERINALLEDLKEKWKDILKGSLEAAITAFLSNIVVFLINLFATTLKRLVTMIRAGFVSLCQAVKILADPPDWMDREEVNYQALKVLTAGLIGAASMGLHTGIENLLLAIPGLQPLMMFPVPFPGEAPRTVGDILSGTLTAMAGGVLTTVALYFMDGVRADSKKNKLQIQLIAQSGVVVHYKIAQTWCVVGDGYFFLHNQIKEGAELCVQVGQELEILKQETNEAVDAYSKSVANLGQRLKSLKNMVPNE